MNKTIYLQEGKAQALSILKDFTNKDELVQQLMLIDPTPSKKYVEVFAKILKSWMLNGNSSSIMIDRLRERLAPLVIEAEKKKAVIDLNRITTFDDLESILKKEANRITRSSIKKGIQGLTVGEDYTVVYENDTVIGLMPFSWKASKIIASNYVGGVTGEWCIAYQKTDEYWDDIVCEQSQAPVFMIKHKKSDDDDSTKYAFMYSDMVQDLDIWNEHDAKERDNDIILGNLNISGEDNSQIFSKARMLAKEHIESFGESKKEHHEEKIFSYHYEIDTRDQTVEGSAYIEKREWDGEDYDDMDSETEQYESVEGDYFFASEWFKDEEGIALLQGIKEEISEMNNDSLLDELPNILQNTIIIKYNGANTFSDIYNSVESEYYDDSSDDVYTSGIRKLLIDTNTTSLIFICSGDESNIHDEPFRETLQSIYHDRTKELEPDHTYAYGAEQLSYTIYSVNPERLRQGLENRPSLKNVLSGSEEWVRDDEREGKYGQQFMQYEQLKNKLISLRKKYN